MSRRQAGTVLLQRKEPAKRNCQFYWDWFSKLLHKFFQRDFRMAQDALQRLGHKLPVIGHGDVNIALAHANMRTLLPHNFKSKPPQDFHGFRAGNIPR